MTTISSTDFAHMVGITGRQVRNLVEKGIMVRQGDGFHLEESINRYCASLRAAAVRGSEGTSEAAADRARLARARATHAETKNAVMLGELVRADEVQAEWSGILRGVRAGMLAVPSRVAQRLPHLTTHDIAELHAEVRAALTEISARLTGVAS